MATTKTHSLNKWDTLHNNGPFPLKKLYVTELEGDGNMPDKIDRYNDAAKEIQRLIKESQEANHGFRGYGSAWSMNHIASHKDRMHYNGFMNIHIPIIKENCHTNTNFEASNLFLFECGTTIKRISEVLSAHGKSLKTTGASNGQTIAGCISTGVHGSALQVGAVQDYVVGLNLIIGPNEEDVVYIERHTEPALNDDFANHINCRIIRNDKLFNATLVSLGSFGFIHGIVLEAEPRYLLKRYVKKINKATALKLSDTLDFKNSIFKIPLETDSEGHGITPYHFKVFINQYSKESDYVVELMYKKPYVSDYKDPFPIIKQSLYRDLIHLFTKMAENFPKSIPWLVKRLEKTILPQVDEELIGTLPQIFWDAPYQGPAFACSVGVDYKNSSKALKLMAEITTEEGPIPGIFAMRFVKQSKATLAFTKFPVTCMLEIDGVLWNKTNKIMSLTEFSRRMIEVLKQNNIPFTIHWGKNSDWTFPNLVNHMYESSEINEWKACRSALLSEDMMELFSNKFLRDIGLADRESHVNEDLITFL
ncbi:FAD-linked oxidase [Winogradskyella bathintestinalis]|uniref:FAD-linked oxidase n=1 Tax=Winogradskyella bathintestinalis TaxID=3035208 RepID=A0ABT7ZX10_9FLAO|nr:FAD-linked oxidase [Winogradskyella bathintestinalis]MDN3493542.1 FAD-linked oxidase [Winogradskyella bathintestinalis]